jgi:F-type H+-transporting ATPase subunit c
MEPVTTTQAVAQVASGMTPEVARLFAKAITIVAMMPTAIGEGYVVAKAMEAMGRNPDAADTIFPKMIVGVAMCESTAIYALVAFFLI